jgi:hypothetical protein
MKQASKASDVADNPYYARDARRSYPRYAPVTQGFLAQLLLSSPEKAAQIGCVQAAFPVVRLLRESHRLPAPVLNANDSKALTESGTVTSIAALYPAEGGQATKFYGGSKLPCVSFLSCS